MEPLLRGMVTANVDSLCPPVTVTASTHCKLLVVLTAVVYVSPTAVDVNPKSDTATPVTASENVAVNRMVDDVVEAPVAPTVEENVGMGGLYLHAHTPIDTRRRQHRIAWYSRMCEHGGVTHVRGNAAGEG